MSLVSSLAVYFIIWWTVLFAVLPFGIRHHEREDVALGTDHGAPIEAGLLRKVILTTLISAAIFAGVYVYFGVLDFTLEDLML